MRKDYANRVFTTSRARKKQRARIEFLIFPFIIILFLAGFVFYVHKTSQITKDESFFSRVKLLFTHSATNKSPHVSKTKINSDNSVPASVHFDFYNQLPAMQVTISNTTDNQATPPPPASSVKKPNAHTPMVTTTSTPATIHDPEAPVSLPPVPVSQYIIQLGVFKDSASASQSRISLLLAGSEATIVKMKTAEGEIYRVQRGPFMSQAEAKKIQKQLQKKGIEGELKKI